jgi:predicted NUDIX family NTP pyrophosphohydrolase
MTSATSATPGPPRPPKKSPKLSAGILLFRHCSEGLEILLAHPGGPFWAKDDSAWSIPKGLYEPEVDPDPQAAAVREFTEEVGWPPPPGPYLDLGRVTLASRKVVAAWAVEGNLDPSTAFSNTIELEWPYRSGQFATFPEVDRVEWFTVAAARPRLSKGQLPLLERLVVSLTN